MIRAVRLPSILALKTGSLDLRTRYPLSLGDSIQMPIGPTGPTGPTGPAGPTGPTGPTATNDFANIATTYGVQTNGPLLNPNASQEITNVPSTVDFDVVSPSNNIVPVAPIAPATRYSQVRVTSAGAYAVLYSPQWTHTSGGSPVCGIGVAVNGTPVADSASAISVKNGEFSLATAQVILTLGASDIISFIAVTDSITVELTGLPAIVGPPAFPAAPAFVATIVRLS
jgi:hypothetical protein